jgi:hypothetical protein
MGIKYVEAFGDLLLVV